MEGMTNLMTIGELKAYLNCHQSSIYRFIQRGMPALKLGADWRFRKEDIDRWLEECSVVNGVKEPK